MNHFEYYINEKERAPAGQIYLGAFLALTLFSSFVFGSLLFFLIVLIICVFIFLEKGVPEGDEWGRVKVVFSPDYFSYGKSVYKYGDVAMFSVHRELFGVEEIHFRIVFRSRSKSDLFIYLPTEVHLKNIYDIIAPLVKEDKKKKLSITDQLFIRFF